MDLNGEDGVGFRNFTRMSASDFECILEMIGHKIAKQNTNFRCAIPPAVRLAITIRFLASGDSFTSLMYLFKVSKQAISVIIPEVCLCLIEALQDYVKIPSSPQQWSQIAQEYNVAWNFPHCLGAMDGKHVLLQAPNNSGSLFYNYKGTFSIVLFAVVDAKYNIIYANCGCQGRISDGGVFKNTPFYQALSSDNLHLPAPEPLPGREELVPYVLVADDAFPLGENIMKPYPGLLEKKSSKRAYNYRLCRARRIVENVFGLLSTVFRVFRKPMAIAPQKAEIVVMTCVYLHNFLRRNSQAKARYTPPGTFDMEDLDTGVVTEGSWRREMDEVHGIQNLRGVPRKPPSTASRIRDEFSNYFVSTEGKVPWQDEYI